AGQDPIDCGFTVACGQDLKALRGEYTLQRLDDSLVVIDDEDFPLVRAIELFGHPMNALDELLPVDRLHEIVDGAESESFVAVVDDGYQDDGNICGFPVIAQDAEDVKPIYTRHQDVERDD